MIKTFTNNLEATAYGYAMGVLALTETDREADPTITAVSAETESRVKIYVNYNAGKTISEYRDSDNGQIVDDSEYIELTTSYFIDMGSIDLVMEAETLQEFLEVLKYDEGYNGEDFND